MRNPATPAYSLGESWSSFHPFGIPLPQWSVWGTDIAKPFILTTLGARSRVSARAASGDSCCLSQLLRTSVDTFCSASLSDLRTARASGGLKPTPAGGNGRGVQL